MKTCLIPTLLLSLVLSVCVSCSGQKFPDGMPKLFPCTIKLVQEGQPLADATILLESADPETNKWAITGTTDANGMATIATMGKYLGAPAGQYTVLVTKDETVYKNPPKEVNGEKIMGPYDVFSHVALEMSDKAKSPLKITVEEKKNSFDLDAGKKVRIARPKEPI